MEFDEIYERNVWGSSETRSGPGSGWEATAVLRRVIPEMVAGVGAQTVLDAACGEGLWMPDLPGYIGVDIVPDAIASAHRRHPRWKLFRADIRKDRLPRADVVICKDVLTHMSLWDGIEVLNNLRRCHATWLLATTFEDGENVNVERGGFYRTNLQEEPFSLGRPWMVIEDDVGEDPRLVGKYLGVFSL